MTSAYLFGRWQVEKAEAKKPSTGRFKSADEIRAYNKMLADQRKAAKAVAQQDKPQQTTTSPAGQKIHKAAQGAKKAPAACEQISMF